VDTRKLKQAPSLHLLSRRVLSIKLNPCSFFQENLNTEGAILIEHATQREEGKGEVDGKKRREAGVKEDWMPRKRKRKKWTR
jgi:hypothetical protein